MGAYENPPMIQTPNYGDIISRNVQNIVAIGEQKRKEKEAKILAAGERKTEYARRAGNIKAGALTENINQIGLGLTDSYTQNEDLFAKGQISAEEYANNKSKYETALNTLSTAGSTIREFGESIKKLDISGYQENPELIALVDAYKRGAVDAQIVDGKVELHYEAPDGSIMEVDETWLSNQDSWNITEKFNSDEITTDLAKIVEGQINQEVSTKVTNEDGTVTTSEERYSQAYGTEEKRLNQIMQNKVVSGLDRQELGSYYMDKVSSNIDAQTDADLEAVLNAQNLSEEQKKQIKQDVASGSWSNREFKNNDKNPVNSGDILREVAKRKLAKEVLEKVSPPKVKVQTAVDETATDYEKELNRYTDTSEGQQLENMRSLQQLIKDNGYEYRAINGVGYVFDRDEEGNLIEQPIQSFNLKDPYDVSKGLVKIKYGDNTKEGRKLIDDITKEQVNAPRPEVVRTPSGQPEGFEQGLYEPFSVDIKGEKLTFSNAAKDELEVKEAASELRITETIPQALKDNNIPVTVENINKVRDAARRKGVTLDDVLEGISKKQKIGSDVQVSSNQEEIDTTYA
jgi:hypothetical protein